MSLAAIKASMGQCSENTSDLGQEANTSRQFFRIGDTFQIETCAGQVCILMKKEWVLLLGAKTTGFPPPKLHVVNRWKGNELNQLPKHDCC
jgi:hypothetical protein